jgi:hypothetical protein
MRLRNIFNKPQSTAMVDGAADKADEQTVDAPKQPTSEGEMYSDLLTMNMFANYYPHVFPDHSMFR